MSDKIKPFHELTKEEFAELQKTKMTWEECAKKYPQPDWCSYPEAVMGIMGCLSLMNLKDKKSSKEDCGKCEFVIGSEEYKAERKRWDKPIAIQEKRKALDGSGE